MINRTPANFRAEREGLGLSRADLARALGVEERAVKRWESPREANAAPGFAWDYLAETRSRHEWTVDTALSKAFELTEDLGRPRKVALTYYTSQASLDAAGKPGFVGAQNAISREVADVLRADGFAVDFVYPGTPEAAWAEALGEAGNDAS